MPRCRPLAPLAVMMMTARRVCMKDAVAVVTMAVAGMKVDTGVDGMVLVQVALMAQMQEPLADA